MCAASSRVIQCPKVVLLLILFTFMIFFEFYRRIVREIGPGFIYLSASTDCKEVVVFSFAIDRCLVVAAKFALY